MIPLANPHVVAPAEFVESPITTADMQARRDRGDWLLVTLENGEWIFAYVAGSRGDVTRRALKAIKGARKGKWELRVWGVCNWVEGKFWRVR